MKKFLICLLVLCFLSTSLFPWDSSYLENIFFVRGSGSVLVLDLKTNLLALFIHGEKAGFKKIGSLETDCRRLGPGFYLLMSDSSRGMGTVVVSNIYPREMMCREIVIDTLYRKFKCPMIIIDRDDFAVFQGFLKVSGGKLVVLDSVSVVDSLTYLRKLAGWEGFLNDYIDFCESGNAEDMTRFYSNYYRDDNNRDLGLYKKVFELSRSLARWTEIKYDSAVVVEIGDFAHVYFYQKLYTDKKIECSKKFLTLIRETRGWKIVYEGTRVVSCCFVKDLIEKYVGDWVKAWESLDIERYKRFYSIDFTSGDKGLDDWISHKRKVFSSLKWVNVDIEKFSVLSQEKMLWKVEFLQKYESDRGKDVGYKILYIRGEPGNFEIVKEVWIPVE